MEGSAFDELKFFSAIEQSGARALLIGRQALIALGLPLLTRDYDYWIHVDDIEIFNQAVFQFDMIPNRTPEEARKRGRYVLENDEHVDVLVARHVSTVGGEVVHFDTLWEQHESLEVGQGIQVALPKLEDLALTKQFATRQKDLEDLRLLKILIEEKQK